MARPEQQPAPLPLISQQKQIRETTKKWANKDQSNTEVHLNSLGHIACFVSTQGACDQCVSVQHAAT
jgi:hypothetical protein